MLYWSLSFWLTSLCIMGSWITLTIWFPSGSLETLYMLNRGCLCNQSQIKTLNPEPQWTFLVYNILHLGAPLLPGEIKCVLWTPLGDALWEHLLNFFCTSPHRFFPFAHFVYILSLKWIIAMNTIYWGWWILLSNNQICRVFWWPLQTTVWQLCCALRILFKFIVFGTSMYSTL